MRRTLACSILAIVVAAAAVTAGAQSGQTYVPPRTPDGQPDLQGIWQVLNTSAAWNLEPHTASWGVPAGLGVITDPPDRLLPYQSSAMAKKRENLQNRDAADPLAKCYKPGVPRLTYLPFPFQIVQSPQLVTIFYEYI